MKIKVIKNNNKFLLDRNTKSLIIGLDTNLFISDFTGNTVSTSPNLDTQGIKIYNLDASPNYIWGHFSTDGKTTLYSINTKAFSTLQLHLLKYDSTNNEYYAASTDDYTLCKYDAVLNKLIWKSSYGVNQLHHENDICFIRQKTINLSLFHPKFIPSNQ